MPAARIESPLAGGATLVHVREVGHGSPLLILHGAWGYAYYPFDAQLAELAGDFRCVIPDRTGYGRSRSPGQGAFPARFHEAAAIEAEAVLDALGIGRCAIWGHSDGAVIAVWMALRHPERCAAVVLEALHVERAKPASRAFFTMMAEDPDGFGERVTSRLAAEHGDDAWRGVLREGGRTWLDIAATPGEDLYDGRLGELRVPALVIQGTDDPRTEPDELDRVRRAAPGVQIQMISGGGHSPHSNRSAATETTRHAAVFLRAHR